MHAVAFVGSRWGLLGESDSSGFSGPLEIFSRRGNRCREAKMADMEAVRANHELYYTTGSMLGFLS